MKQRGWALGVVSVLALASAGAAWKLWRNQLGGLSLKEELAAARREGVPLEPRDLMEPVIPTAENAAGLYLQATSDAAALQKSHPWPKRFESLRSSYKPSEVEDLSTSECKRLRALIAPYHSAFARIREASQRPKLALNRQWGPAEPFLDIYGLRMLLRVLILRAKLRGFEGDFEGALTDLEDAARASSLLVWGKSWYEGQMRVKFENDVWDAMRAIVVRHPSNPRLPQRIRRVVALFGPPTSLRRALASEPYNSLQFIAISAAGTDPCVYSSPWLKLRSVREANEAYAISYWRYLFSRIPDDPLAFESARFAMRDAISRYEEENTLRTQGVLIPAVEGTVIQFASQEARRRIALTAADVLERWQQEAQPPLAAPQVRHDPFGGDLRYRREPKGFVVYSVHADGVDDGGREPSPGRGEAGDIAWRMTLPATIAVAKR